MKKNLLFFMTIMLSFASFAQWTQLNHSLLSGIEDRSMIYTGTAVLIANEGGVFRSVNNGNTWHRANTGLDTANLDVNDIAYVQNKVWLSADGLYSSTNDGLTWTKNPLNGLSSNGWVGQIAKKGNRLFIFYSYYDNTINDNITLICYSDDGLLFHHGDTLGMGGNTWYDFMPDNEYALLYCDQNGNDLYYSYDGINRDTFSLAGLPLNTEIKSRLFAIDSLGNNVFILDENLPQIFKYNFITEQWDLKVNGISNALAIFSIHTFGDVSFACVYSQNPLPAITLYRSLDSAGTWVPVVNPGILIPLFQNNMVRTANNRFIGTELYNDLYISDNNGQSWTKNTNIYSLSYHNLFTLSNGDLITFRENYGILKSTDNGQTWAQFNGDMPSFIGIYLTTSIFYDGTNMYAIGSDSPDGPHALYKSINSGQNWTLVNTAPDSSRMSFAGLIGDKLMLYFGDENNGTYEFTTNQGTSWTNISQAIDILGLDRILGLTGNSDTLFLFGRDFNYEQKVYMSVNNGQIFTDISVGLIDFNRHFFSQFEWDWRIKPRPVAAFGNNNQGLVVPVNDYSVYPHEIKFYKLNSNLTWSLIATDGIEVPHNVRVGQLIHTNDIWYLSTSIGVFASLDGCNTWNKIWNNQGLQLGMQHNELHINNNDIYLATNGLGIWKTQITAPVLTTKPIINISGTHASSGGVISSTGGMPFIQKGLCYATHTLPTVNNDIVDAGASFASFDATMLGLSSGQTYFVRAFIITHNDTVYGNELSFSTNSTIVSAQILPTSADYGLTNPGNVHTFITWNDATAITSITDNFSTVLALSDYNLSGNYLAISQSYLSGLLTASGQTVTLTITFDVGAPAVFVITAVQSAINHAYINPQTAYFDIAFPAHIQTNITFNDASSVMSIIDNQATPYTLVFADYALTGSTLGFFSSYLATVLTNPGDSIVLTINFDFGNPATFIVYAYETVSAELNPDTADFVINTLADVKTTIAWNSAMYITSIVDDQIVPYSLTVSDFIVNADTLVIFDAYLSQVIPNDSDVVVLTVNFNVGNPQTFTITAISLVGIDEIEDKNFHVYPNPANDILYVSSSYNESLNLGIFNMNGQLVYQVQKSAFEGLMPIDISTLSSGTYFIRIQSHTDVVVNKFVIVR